MIPLPVDFLRGLGLGLSVGILVGVVGGIWFAIKNIDSYDIPCDFAELIQEILQEKTGNKTKEKITRRNKV